MKKPCTGDWIYLIVISIYISPAFIIGKDYSVPIWDNFDSNLIWTKLLLDNNLLFAHPDAVVSQLMGGVSRGSLGGYLNLEVVPLSLFGIYWGYQINRAIMIFIAFYGMRLLLCELIDNKQYLIIKASSLLFAMLPFWSFNISVAGMPLVFYAFLKLYRKEEPTIYFFVILFFSLYSSLALVGIFILFVLVLLLLLYVFKKRSFNKPFCIGMIVMLVSYIGSNYGLIYQFINNGIESHRLEFVDSYSEGIYGFVNTFFSIFVRGQDHSESKHLILIPFIFLGIVLIYYRSRKQNLKLNLLLGFLILTSLFYSLWYNTAIKSIREIVQLVFPFQMQRFHFLHPFLWYVLLALVSARLLQLYKSKLITFLIILVFIGQFTYLLTFHPLLQHERSFGFNEYVSENLFSQAKYLLDNRENDNSYRVGSVGIQPAVALYNGFYTIDGYVTTYPLNYKHQFRKIIADELEKNERIREYYDNWGSRVYLFTDQLSSNGWDIRKGSNRTLDRIDFNIEALKQLNCKYILSAIPINDTKFGIIAYFNDNVSAFDLYIYEII